MRALPCPDRELDDWFADAATAPGSHRIPDAGVRREREPSHASSHGTQGRDAAPVVWITGLSGVGKSALAGQLVQSLRDDGHAARWLDGDALRRRFGQATASFDRAARLALAQRYATLAAAVAASGEIAVVSTVSLFHTVQADNRSRLPRYLEVWLRAPEPLRRARAHDRGGGPRVGHELACEFPRAADLVLDNDDRPATLLALCDQLRSRLEP